MTNEIIDIHIQNNDTSALYNLILDVLERGTSTYIDKAVLFLLDAIHSDKMSLYESLPDICTKMQEPLIIVEKLNEELEQNSTLSFYAAYTLYLLQTSLDIDIPNFCKNFYNIINKENIITHRHKFFSFVKLILYNDNLPLKIVKTYIKKLCRIAVDIESYICLEILNLVYTLMKLHPMCFVMCNEEGYIECDADTVTYESFQPYLYELDILSSGIQPIRKMVNAIRNESYKSKEKYDRKALIEKETNVSIYDE
ncbi:Maturation and nuclear export of 40S ribosomal subunits interacting protein [Binucleata daphniae]